MEKHQRAPMREQVPHSWFPQAIEFREWPGLVVCTPSDLSEHFIFAGKNADFGIVLDHHDAGTFARRERSVSRLSANSLPPWARGRYIVKVAPAPSTLSTKMSPPDCLVKPNPWLRLRPVSSPTPFVVKNGWKIWSILYAEMPAPVSVNAIMMKSPGMNGWDLIAGMPDTIVTVMVNDKAQVLGLQRHDRCTPEPGGQ